MTHYQTKHIMVIEKIKMLEDPYCSRTNIWVKGVLLIAGWLGTPQTSRVEIQIIWDNAVDDFANTC